MPASLPQPLPGPRSRWRLHNALLYQRDRLAFMRMLASYGDIATVRIGQGDAYFLNHPDLVRDLLVTRTADFSKGRALRNADVVLGKGLLTNEGESHRRQRRLVQPAFHPSRVTSYAQVMVQHAKRLGDSWREGQTINIHAQMLGLTLGIAAKTLFDAEVDEQVKEIGNAVTIAVEMFDRAMTPWGPWLGRLPLPSNFRFKRARGYLFDTIARLIAERRAKPFDRGDFLSILLTARDEADEERDDSTASAASGMTDDQVRDEAITIFLAGHETTANAFTFTWYALAKHPDIAEQLRHELRDVLGDRMPTGDDLPRLVYTRQVVSEAMRLYPPAWALGRSALRDIEIAGHAIPAGSLVLASQWAMHRDERFWPDAERFDPTRWTDAAIAVRPRWAYFPFGGGPRVCIGESFAWMELVLVIATLAGRWRMESPKDFVLKLQPTITLRPRGGMPMVVRDIG